MTATSPFIIRVQCPDQPGLIYAVAQAVVQAGGNFTSYQEFVQPTLDDTLPPQFFMRAVVAGSTWPAATLQATLQQNLPTQARVQVLLPTPKRLVVLASKEYHCLGELLTRHHFGDMHAHIVGVISNHTILQNFVQQFGLPFVHINHETMSREDHEQAVQQAVANFAPDYVVLAKYMRILSEEFVGQWPNRLINIHHSFLPAFVGAKPYAQAHARGVKLIGATAHFVTTELDAGPIIAQNVVPVDHNFTATDMARAGRDVEKQTLQQALDAVCAERVFVHSNRTVVF